MPLHSSRNADPRNITAVARLRAALAALLILGAWGDMRPARADETPRMGGTLTMPGVNGTPWPNLSWLEPGYHVGNLTISALIQGTLFSSPAQIGGPVIPELATGYQYNADNTAVTLKLRPGVTFTDGTPLNADAIVWLWSPEFDMNAASKAATYLADVASVKAVDDLTVQVTFKTADTTFVAALATQPVGLVASPTAFHKLGRNRFDQFPIGAGAFTVEAHVPNQSIVLKRNAGYWDAAHVYLDTIREVLTGTDPTANYQKLESGQVDLLTNVHVFAYDPEIIKQALNNPKLAHAPGLGASFAFVDFTNTPPFNNRLARQALFYCTEREPITEETLNGFAEPAYIWGGPAGAMDYYPTDPKTGKASVGAAHALYPYDHDPEKARAIVKQLGGLKFKLTSDIAKTITTALQQEWAECGIEAEIYFPPPAQYVSILQNGTYQAYLVNTAGVPDPRLFAKYLTSQQPLNQQHEVEDPIITAAFDKSLGDTGAAVQQEWTTIFSQLNKDAYLLPIIAAPNYTVYNPCLHDFSYFGNYITFLHSWRSCK